MVGFRIVSVVDLTVWCNGLLGRSSGCSSDLGRELPVWQALLGAELVGLVAMDSGEGVIEGSRSSSRGPQLQSAGGS